MALIRAFTPNQYRSSFLGSIGPFYVNATVPSTAAGAVGAGAASAASSPGPTASNAAALANLLQASDVVLDVIPVVAQPSLVVFSGQITSNGNLTVLAQNGTGGAYNPGALVFMVFVLRLKTA